MMKANKTNKTERRISYSNGSLRTWSSNSPRYTHSRIRNLPAKAMLTHIQVTSTAENPSPKAETAACYQLSDKYLEYLTKYADEHPAEDSFIGISVVSHGPNKTSLQVDRGWFPPDTVITTNHKVKRWNHTHDFALSEPDEQLMNHTVRQVREIADRFSALHNFEISRIRESNRDLTVVMGSYAQSIISSSITARQELSTIVKNRLKSMAPDHRLQFLEPHVLNRQFLDSPERQTAFIMAFQYRPQMEQETHPEVKRFSFLFKGFNYNFITLSGDHVCTKCFRCNHTRATCYLDRRSNKLGPNEEMEQVEDEPNVPDGPPPLHGPMLYMDYIAAHPDQRIETVGAPPQGDPRAERLNLRRLSLQDQAILENTVEISYAEYLKIHNVNNIFYTVHDQHVVEGHMNDDNHPIFTLQDGTDAHMEELNDIFPPPVFFLP